MKLYVITHKGLSNPQKAVQCGHAVADFCQKNPDTKWRNGTLVYLVVKDEEELKWLYTKIGISDFLGKIEVGIFHEPYYNYQLTAIAAFGEGVSDICKNLKLL